MRAILKQSPTLARAVGSQAIFCMETAFKLLVWSTVVYEDAAADERMPPLKGHSILKPNRLRNQRMQVQENGDAEVGLFLWISSGSSRRKCCFAYC